MNDVTQPSIEDAGDPGGPLDGMHGTSAGDARTGPRGVRRAPCREWPVARGCRATGSSASRRAGGTASIRDLKRGAVLRPRPAVIIGRTMTLLQKEQRADNAPDPGAPDCKHAPQMMADAAFYQPQWMTARAVATRLPNR